MSEEIDKIWYPADKDALKAELEKENPKLPCNIWGIIKDLEERISALEKGV